MKYSIKDNFRFFVWLTIGLMSLFIHGCASVNESQTSKTAAVNQCVLIDTDFDIDDMMAIPLVIGHKHVAAIVTSEGYTKPDLGAAALSRLIAEPNQRNIPVIIGASTHLDEKKIVSEWGQFVLQYRTLMNRLNNFTITAMPPSAKQVDYKTEVTQAVSNCKSVDILIIGTFSSFVEYSPLIESKINQVVIMGKALEGDTTQRPGNFSFNCEYDMPACKKAFYEQLPKYKYVYVDVPRSKCDTTPNSPQCKGTVYGPTLKMAKKLDAEGLPNTLKQVLLGYTNSWNLDTWPNKIYGGKSLLWDQSAALYMVYPEIFKKLGGPEGHFESAVSPEEFRAKWTEATNQAKTYK
jgi:inosine-uridine nucleoside N-ribohydrolase